MAKLRLRWRFFWSRRSATRTALALILALLALLASLYLGLPTNWRHQVTTGLLAVVQGVGTLGPEPLLIILTLLCFAASLAFIIVPSYRRQSYLATAPSSIPLVSVYLDAENQLPEPAIRPFIDFLIAHLNGRRADLLYFLDASLTATSMKYKTLYRFGFRPVDVPHNPTGTSAVKEAVDRELAMHAYERALLGPPGQEFIIVTGDADFVPLIYRLVALGHRVQIWAAPVRDAYQIVRTYLGINVIDLSQVIPELKTALQPLPPANQPLPRAKSPFPIPKAPLPTSDQKRQRSPRRRRPQRSALAQVAAPTSLTQPGEKQLYYAVAETLVAHAEALRRFSTDNERKGHFYSLMRAAYAPRMASVGYRAGKWLDYWLEYLVELGVLQQVDGLAFPQRGPTTAEGAARSLFVLTEAAANVAVALGVEHEDGLVHMRGVADALAAESSAGSILEDDAAGLLKLLAVGSDRRIPSARYFIRCARALGLLQFEDVPESLDIISRPRLPAAPPSPNESDTAHDTSGWPTVVQPPSNTNSETV